MHRLRRFLSLAAARDNRLETACAALTVNGLGLFDDDVAFQPRDGVWNPASVVRIEERENRVARIVDYNHCPWVLASAELVVEAPV